MCSMRQLFFFLVITGFQPADSVAITIDPSSKVRLGTERLMRREQESTEEHLSSSTPTDAPFRRTAAVPAMEAPAAVLEYGPVIRAPVYTAVDIAEDVPYNNIWEQMITFPKRRPRQFNAILATFKTWSADAIVQFGERRFARPWKFDWKRSITFALFGFLYIGLAQWVLYVTLLTWLFPRALVFANAPLSMKLKDPSGMLDMLGQICVDNFIFGVFLYFPVFYMLKSILQGNNSIASRIQTGLSKYRINMKADNLANIAVWTPADIVIFACPMYLRMPMEHFVSFGWTMYISASRGASGDLDSKFEPSLHGPESGPMQLIPRHGQPSRQQGNVSGGL